MPSIITGSWRRKLVFIVSVTAIFSGLGMLAFLALPPISQSVAEIAIRSENLSLDGLARLRAIDPRRGVELQDTLQFLQSVSAAEYASTKLEGYSTAEIVEATSTKIDERSGLVTISVNARSSEDALVILRAILARARELEKERRKSQVDELARVVKSKLTATEAELKEIHSSLAKFLKGRDILFSLEQERQQAAAALQEQFDRELLELLVERDRLMSQMDAIQLDRETSPTRVGSLAQGEESRLLVEARKAASEGEAAFSAAQSRYGANHSEVKATKVRMELANQNLAQAIADERRSVETAVRTTTKTLATVQERVNQSRADYQGSDVSLDPQYLALSISRDSLLAVTRELSSRLAELEIFSSVYDGAFTVISSPFPSKTRSLKAFLAIFALSTLAGLVCSGAYVLLTDRARKQSSFVEETGGPVLGN